MHSSAKKIPTHHHAYISQCINDLGVDILVSQILVWLPSKCVGRCRCVSKEWRSLLSTRKFAIAHSRHTSNAYNQKFIAIGLLSGYVLPVDFEHMTRSSTTVIPLPFERSSCHVSILNILDGLLCICLRDTGELLIWNPLTQLCKKVSNHKNRGSYNPTPDADIVSLYVDGSDDYMLLHIKRINGKRWVYTYSLRTDVWRTIGFINERNCSQHDIQWSNGTFCRGIVYFTITRNDFGPGNMLVGFHVNSKRFHDITYPNVGQDDYDGSLLTIHNNLHIFVTYGYPKWTVDLWKREGDSWTKVWVSPPITPILVGYNITYIISPGTFLMVDDYGFANELDVTIPAEDCYYPVLRFSGLKGAIYIETLVSPHM